MQAHNLLGYVTLSDRLTTMGKSMNSAQEKRLLKALNLIDIIELRLKATVALITLHKREGVDLDDINILLRSVIDECRSDI